MVMKCDLCEGRLIMQSGGKSAVCADCGLEYSFERLKEKIAEAREATKKEKVESPSPAVSELDPEAPVVYEAEWEDEPAEEPTVYEAEWEDEPAEEPVVYDAEWEDEPAEDNNDHRLIMQQCPWCGAKFQSIFSEEPLHLSCPICHNPGRYTLTKSQQIKDYRFNCKNCGDIVYIDTDFPHVNYCDNCIPIIAAQRTKTKRCKSCNAIVPEYINEGYNYCIDCMKKAIANKEVVRRVIDCNYCKASKTIYFEIWSKGMSYKYICKSCGKQNKTALW